MYLLTADDCILTHGSFEQRANFVKDDYCIKGLAGGTQKQLQLVCFFLASPSSTPQQLTWLLGGKLLRATQPEKNRDYDRL